MDSKFDTMVQVLKYRVIKELVRAYDANEMDKIYLDIPKKICPGPKPNFRCCIYKERAIVQERITLALGGDKENANIVEVIGTACDECPIAGMYVTPACRGCISHKCKEVCPKDAITIVNNRPIIDMARCIRCGRCAKACPYSAIIEQSRPCVTSCPVKAISIDGNDKAKIDNDKCIGCGACVYQCPFGAIVDKSYVVEALDILKNSNNNTDYKVYAIVAPAIVSQFRESKFGQVISGIKALGFAGVYEAALGADITIYREAKEFKEKQLMTTSCCPSFVSFVEKNFPELAQYISHSPSPMVETAMLLKRKDKNIKTIFIGPCTSKKLEFKLEKTKGAIDCVLSFEELQAFFDGRNIEIESMEESTLDDASLYGRVFAKCGGITQDIQNVATKFGVDNIAPIAMSGITECRVNLLKLKLGKSVNNFFEGMACDGGCINGALCLRHDAKSASFVDDFSKKSVRHIDESVQQYENSFDNELK